MKDMKPPPHSKKPSQDESIVLKAELEKEGLELDFKSRMSYSDYLGLDAIITAQKPLSTAHDEMLFIIQHQTSELWMRLAIHEMMAARSALIAKSYRPAFKMMARISRIFEQLNAAWDVLRTMTPSEYTKFREQLGQSSGFQSYQYRQIEFIFGNRNLDLLRPHQHRPEIHDLLQKELNRPSLYDVALHLLHEEVMPLPESIIKRDLNLPHRHDDTVMEAWRLVYCQPDQYWTLYELGEKLVDIEDYFRRWRFNHVTTVERVIGFKRGSGGSGGVSYLKRMLDIELFPELWHVRTVL